MRTREAKIHNTKINLYEKLLQELCEKFDGAEFYIKERIEELCSEKKLSAEGNSFVLFVYERLWQLVVKQCLCLL